MPSDFSESSQAADSRAPLLCKHHDPTWQPPLLFHSASVDCRVSDGTLPSKLDLQIQRAKDRVAEKRTALASPDGAMEYFLSKRGVTAETDLVARWQQAKSFRANQRNFSTKLGRFVDQQKTGELENGRWEFLGPGNVGGRTRALLIDPDEPSTMYAAGVSGGIWKSTDGGASWQPRGELMSNLAVVSLVMHPNDSNVLFAGTGEGVYVNRPRTRSRGIRGDGIFVSRDAGDSWNPLSATNNGSFNYVNRLVFGNQGRLYAATASGLWLSDDDGSNWRRTLEIDDETGCLELAVQPGSNPDVLLLSCGSFQPSESYRSADSGETWARILEDETPGGGRPGRTTFAFAPSDPQVAYAMAATSIYADYVNGGPFEYELFAVYRTADAGQTWEKRTDGLDRLTLGSLLLSNPIVATDDGCGISYDSFGQGWFDNAIAVDPTNANVVWAGGVDLFRSDDGGETWGIASYWWIDEQAQGFVHADQHLIVFHPEYDGVSNTTMYVTNDGGLFYTDNPMAATSSNICEPGTAVRFTHLNNSYGVTQFYHGSVFPGGDRYMGGTQDNGTVMGTDGDGEDAWQFVRGGDGGFSAITPENPEVFYNSIQFGYFTRTDDGGETFVDIDPGFDSSGFRIFIPPLVMDPADSDTLWTGGERIMRTRDRGESWERASYFVPPQGFNFVSSIAVSPHRSGQVVVGTTGSEVMSNGDALNAHANTLWPITRLTSGWISSLRFDPSRSHVVYATVSGFDVPSVWRSLDYGVSWVPLGDISLPKVPAHDILVDPQDFRRLYLATDVGLYVSLDAGRNWSPDTFAAAGAVIEALQLVQRGGERWLYAFTYGRGAHRVALSNALDAQVTPVMSGTWYNPDRNGEGFIVEVNPNQSGTAVIFWFTYDDDGNQVWYVGEGVIAGNRIVVEALNAVSGPRFGDDFDPADIVIQEWGRLELIFDSCTDGIYTYQSTEAFGGVTGQVAMQRLSQVDGLACASTETPLQPAISGNWYDITHDGEGFIIQRLAGSEDQVLVYWFTFDLEGQPMWLVNTGTLVNGALIIDPLVLPRGPTFGPSYNPADLILDPWGSVMFEFNGCESGSAEYVGPEAFGGGSFDLTQLTSAVLGCGDLR